MMEMKDVDTVEKDASIKMKKVPKAAAKRKAGSSKGKGKWEGAKGNGEK